MVKTTIDVDDKVWKVVRIKASREDISTSKALERIIERYTADHGKEIGYKLK